MWGNNSKQFHIKFLQTWKPETLPVFNKKIDLPELVESTSFFGKSGTETPTPGTTVSIGAEVDAQVPLKLVSSTR